MSTCRLTSIVSNCGYDGSGVVELILLDMEDFKGLVYEGKGAYTSCYVENILRTGEAVAMSLRDNPGSYTGQGQGRGYSHRLEAYIGKLSGAKLSKLHLATKRPQLVIFRTLDGKLFTFGSDGGAKFTYTTQTEEGTGAVITLAAASSLPLAEVAPNALSSTGQPFTYAPYWGGTYCQVDRQNDTFTGNLLAPYAVRVSVIDREPLDVNGVPISISGRRAAALRLQDETLPEQYEEVGTYAVGELINGQPTVVYAPEVCNDGEAAAWVLQTGAWDMRAYWLDDGIWNY